MVHTSVRGLTVVVVVVLTGALLLPSSAFASSNNWNSWRSSEGPVYDALFHTMGVQLAAFRAGNVAAAKASEIPLSNALVAEAAHANSPSAALNRDILQFCLDENNVAWYGYLYLVTNNNVYYVRGGRYTAAFAVALKAAVSIVKQHQ